MRCLVTGGSGFLGSALTRRLVRWGHQVAVLSRDPRPWRLEDVRGSIAILQGDLRDPVRALEGATAPDVVFHLAWEKSNRRMDADDSVHFDVNLPATLALLAWLEERRVPRFVGLGSCLEYGRFAIPTYEDAVCEPNTAYGAAKLAAGRAALAARTSAAWVRPFWTYGPADAATHLIPAVAIALLGGESPAVTAGEQRWDYLYLDDAIEAIVRLAAVESARGVFNMSSGNAVPIRAIVSLVAREIGGPAAPRFGALPYPPGQTMHLQGDITRLCETIGWTPAIPLAEGIRRTVAWYAAARHCNTVAPQ